MPNDRFRVQQLDHVELLVPDRYAAAGWYERVFGLSILPGYEHWADDPGGPLMISSDGGSTKLALFAGTPQGEAPIAGFERVAFRVSAAGFLEFLARAGDFELRGSDGRAVTAAAAVDHDRAFSVYLCDPWGNRFEVTCYEHEELRRQLAPRDE